MNADPIQGNQVQQNLPNQDLNQFYVLQNQQEDYSGYTPLAGHFAQPYYPAQTLYPVMHPGQPVAMLPGQPVAMLPGQQVSQYPGQPLNNGLHVYPGHPMYCGRPTSPGQQVPMNPNQSMYTGPAVYPGQPAYPGRQVPIHSSAPAYPGQPTYPNQPSYTSQISYLGQQFRPQYGGSLQYQQNGFMDPPAVWKRSERCLEGLNFKGLGS